MTISGTLAIQKEYIRIEKLKPVVIKILEDNREGLSIRQIEHKLWGLEKCPERKGGDVKKALSSKKYFPRSGEKPVIYRIRIKDS